MHLNSKDKVVSVTGGTKGIGRVIVESFLKEEATVCFCARNADDVSTAASQLTSAFPQAKAHGSVVDVSDISHVTKWVNEAASTCGGIDVVVSNVSALAIADTPEAWQAAFNIDMLATTVLVNTASPHLEKRKGNIISISSVSGRDVDFTAPSPYGAMKAASIHYMAQLAHTLAPKGVRANAVSPGNVYTKEGVWGSIERDNPELFKAQFEKNPMGRMARPEEVADAVLFLASDRASFTSGTNLTVDGASCTGVQL